MRDGETPNRGFYIKMMSPDKYRGKYVIIQYNSLEIISTHLSKEY